MRLYFPVTDTFYSVSMNSFPATDIQPVTGLSDLSHRCDDGSETKTAENAGNVNKVVPSYESATSNVLDIFSTGEVTKAQNGEFQGSDSELLLLLDFSHQRRLSDSFESQLPKQMYIHKLDSDDDFWSLMNQSRRDDKTESDHDNGMANFNNPNPDTGSNSDPLPGDSVERKEKWHIMNNAAADGDLLLTEGIFSTKGNSVENKEFERQAFDLVSAPPVANNDIPDFKQVSPRNECKTISDSIGYPGQELLISHMSVFGSTSSGEIPDAIPMQNKTETDDVGNISSTNQDAEDLNLFSLYSLNNSEKRFVYSPSNEAQNQALANNTSVSQIGQIIPDLSFVSMTADELLVNKSGLASGEAKECLPEYTDNFDTIAVKEETGCYWMDADGNTQGDYRTCSHARSLPETVQNVAMPPGGQLFCETKRVDLQCSEYVNKCGETLNMDVFSTLPLLNPELDRADAALTAPSLYETSCAAILESTDSMVSTSLQGSDHPDGTVSSVHRDDSFSSAEDIYQEQSIYDLYKSDSEEDTPESLRFSSSRTHQGDDTTEFCDTSGNEEILCELSSPGEPYVWGLSDIGYLFSDDDDRKSDCDTTDSVDLCKDVKEVQEQCTTMADKDAETNYESKGDFETNGDDRTLLAGDKDQSSLNENVKNCETTDTTQSKLNDSIVHNPPPRKLRRNSSKVDLLARSKSLEIAEPPCPLVFSERFSKRIQEKLTREGLYDISKPVTADDTVQGTTEDETSREGENILKEHALNILMEGDKLDNSLGLSSDTFPIQDPRSYQGQPTDETDMLLPSATLKDDKGVERLNYESNMLCVEQNKDRGHGVCMATTYHEKQTVHGDPDGSVPRAKSPRQRESSIYDSYPVYDTDDDSHEKLLSLKYMERKLKTKNRLRIIEKICKINSGKKQETIERQPIKIFRGNPIC